MGTHFIWSESKVREAAKGFPSRSYFSKGCRGAFAAAKQYGILNELFPAFVSGTVTKWTENAVRAEAAKYKTRTSFCRGNGSAYAAALKIDGLLDSIFPKRLVLNPGFCWTEELVRKRAKEFESRVAFDNALPAACQFARNNGFIDELFPRKIRKLTDDELVAIMSKYADRGELRKADAASYFLCAKRGLLHHLPNTRNEYTRESIIEACQGLKKRSHLAQMNFSMYNAARAIPGLMDEIFPEKRISREPYKWTREAVIADAANYDSKKAWIRGNVSAHNAAKKYGILNELFPENQPAYGIRDCIYIWHGKDDVFKVGITSSNIDDERIRIVAKDAGFEPKIIVLANVGAFKSAWACERRLKKLGKRVSFGRKFNGSSEFRHFTGDDLIAAIRIVSEYAIDYIKGERNDA